MVITNLSKRQTRSRKIVLTPIKDSSCDGNNISLEHIAQLDRDIAYKKRLLGVNVKYYKCLFGKEIEITALEYNELKARGINVYVK